ncbi:MAG: SHOCT domain-containing protein [Acidimicrobiia bacterium]|jgi:hypothetical protein
MPLLDLFWTMLWLFLFFLWIWLLITLFADIFRRDDMSGWGKAAWVFFLIVLPLLGALIYLIANGEGMAQRQVKDATAMQQAQEDYIRSVAGGGGASTASELEKLAALHDAGKLTDDEFAAQKAKLLS